jgi:hypothetical protein
MQFAARYPALVQAAPTRAAGRTACAGDERAAQNEMAHHLSRKVLRVLTDCAAGYPPSAVPHAVTLINRISPVARRLAGAV